MKTLISPLALVLSAVSATALDLNSNGFPDVWEARYHTIGLVATADNDNDNDNDGQTNAAEALAGTDPFDASSCLTAAIQAGATDSSVTVTTQPGMKYQLLTCSTLAGPWTPTGDPVIASGSTHSFGISPGPGGAFFKVSVESHDSDGDGVDDWSERQLFGFNEQNGKSFASTNDLATATAMIQAWNSNDITIETTTADAFEKENTPAVLTFSRPSAENFPLTIFLETGGTGNPTKSSASAADFALRDANGQTVTTSIVIPAGATSTTLHIHALPDTLTEVPEQLKITIGGTTQSAEVSIRDAQNTEANQRLLIAYLRPLTGITSSGSGIATLRLRGDNDSATVAVNFSNLNSAVNSVQVLNASSSILQSIPPTAYTGQQWLIRATQSYLTDQAVLDSLLSGGVNLGVFTQVNTGGEIGGVFQPTNGSIVFQPPPNPAPIDPLAGTELERDIARFLTQATFGPTLESINDMKARVTAAGGNRIIAYETWINDQFALHAPSLLAYTTASNLQELDVRGPTFSVNSFNRRRGWWLFASAANAQLRERFGMALAEIFVISDVDLVVNNRVYGAANYGDMLRNATSGNYRTLLENVSKSPMMGQYLSHLRNQKATYDSLGNLLVSPDENYAREIMQLFSIGLVQLHPDGSLKLDATGAPIPTYNQNDITELARVFTGWSFSKRNDPGGSNTVVDNNTFNYGLGNMLYEAQWTNPMKMFADRHDIGAKSMIGLSLPAGRTGEQDLTAVVDHLNSHPNTAPFICRRLIQRMVTSNPSSGYLYRVAKKFTDTNGNFPDVIKAILLDPEARSPQAAITLASSGKPKEPLYRTTSFIRAFGLKSSMPLTELTAYGYPSADLAAFPAGTTRYRLNPTTTTTPGLAQSPMGQPNVFNWFLPDYSPPGILAANGLYSPELQIANETTVINVNNFIYTGIYQASGLGTTIGLPASATAQRILPDFVPLENLYMAVVDANADGSFNASDTATFNNLTKLTEACNSVLDRIDLLLCSGELKARYGNTTGQPRQEILDAMVGTDSAGYANTSAVNQKTYMQNRIRTAVWLVMSSPECVIQK